jgi:hypothetical protein
MEIAIEMSTMVDRLYYSLEQAQAATGGWWAKHFSIVGDFVSSDTVRNNLERCSRDIDGLAADQQKVFSGVMNFEVWMTNAKTLLDEINFYMGDVSNWSNSGVVGSTVRATGDEVGEFSEGILDAANPYVAAAVVGLVALAIIVVMK